MKRAAPGGALKAGPEIVESIPSQTPRVLPVTVATNRGARLEVVLGDDNQWRCCRGRAGNRSDGRSRRKHGGGGGYDGGRGRDSCGAGNGGRCWGRLRNTGRVRGYQGRRYRGRCRRQRKGRCGRKGNGSGWHRFSARGSRGSLGRGRSRYSCRRNRGREGPGGHLGCGEFGWDRGSRWGRKERRSRRSEAPTRHREYAHQGPAITRSRVPIPMLPPLRLHVYYG